MNLNKNQYSLLLVFVYFLVSSPTVMARQFFASLNGQTNNPGTFSQPWALDTALRMPTSRVTGGDTIWIRGGIYKGTFTVSINGTALKPVVVQSFPGERAIFDSYTGSNNNVVTLTVDGNYVWLVDIEINNTSPTRISNAPSIGSANDLHQSTGLNLFGSNGKVINCSIHDCPGLGIGYWSSSLNAEVYGSFIYYNGLSAIDRGHGPNFYVQNSDALQPKSIRNCFIFSGFSTGIQFFASGTSQKLKGLIIDSCTVFNQGALTRSNQQRRLNLEAGASSDGKTDAMPNVTRVEGLYVSNNILYRDTTDNMDKARWHQGDFRKNTELGFGDELLSDKFFSFRNNHLYGDPLPILVHKWDSGVFKNNFINSYRANNTGDRFLISMENGSIPFTNWDSNVYHINQPGYTTPFSGKTFSAWKTDFGIDANSSFVNASPTENFVFARRNKYQPNSYYITVMNYLQLDSVLLNESFSAFDGFRFSVFDVQLSTNKAIYSGEYTGQSIKLPLTLTQVAGALGLTPAPPKHTSKTMGTFVITFYPKQKTIKAGNWKDPSVWQTGRIPTHLDDVELLHPITISDLSWCRSLNANNNQISMNSGAYLLVSNAGN